MTIALQIVATGALVGVAASLVGTFLLLRGRSLASDAIGHAIVLGIVLVWLATGATSGPLQLLGAATAGVATVWIADALGRTRRVADDAAIGLTFPALFALGVLLLNVYARDVHIDAHTVLLGEIGFVWLDTVPILGVAVPDALVGLTVVTLVNLAFVTTFFKELEVGTFDPALATAFGFAPGALGGALLALTSVTAVASFDAVGVVLFVAFTIVPAATGYLLVDRLSRILVLAAAVAVASSVLGYLAATAADVSIGGGMAAATGVFFALALAFGPRYGLLAQRIRRRSERDANENRALAVHLYQHAGTPDAGEENVVGALRDHLRWSEGKARDVVARSLDAGWIDRDGERLALTDRGRAAAREILHPGAARRAAPAGS
ncbi:MAG: metal ABC transporter permease [Trueperaceae bacterium]|nr:metal ABC transporter permease [Trueperaceae bacterium]